MKVEIYHFPVTIKNAKKITHDLVATHLGYAEVNEFDANALFHLCNWKCHTSEKPANLHGDIDYCQHGFCFINPETNERWLALTVGWLTGNEKEINDYVRNHKNTWMWL